MALTYKLILDLIKDLPEEKLGKVISFIKFIKDEENSVLLLEEDDEEDILKIMDENEWYSSDEIKKFIEEKDYD